MSPQHSFLSHSQHSKFAVLPRMRCSFVCLPLLCSSAFQSRGQLQHSCLTGSFFGHHLLTIKQQDNIQVTTSCPELSLCWSPGNTNFYHVTFLRDTSPKDSSSCSLLLLIWSPDPPGILRNKLSNSG